MRVLRYIAIRVLPSGLRMSKGAAEWYEHFKGCRRVARGCQRVVGVFRDGATRVAHMVLAGHSIPTDHSTGIAQKTIIAQHTSRCVTSTPDDSPMLMAPALSHNRLDFIFGVPSSVGTIRSTTPTTQVVSVGLMKTEHTTVFSDRLRWQPQILAPPKQSLCERVHEREKSSSGGARGYDSLRVLD